MAYANLDLDDLINEPREALDVEIKEWLDMSNNDHRSLVAKEIIALANHGGGYLIVGMRENADGTFGHANPRPADLNAWSQDAIQSIVAKYVDPGIQCRVHHQVTRSSGDRLPIISIPGGHRVPIRAKAGSPDGKTLVPNRIYVRRPGPSSEEPKTTEEWDRFFERCLQNRQSELLEAMRSILSGIIPRSATSIVTRETELLDFEREASTRWETRVAPLPVDAPPRLLHGFYDVGFAIEGEFDRTTISDLRNIIQTAVREHSGWPPFLTINRQPFAPKPVDGAIECWLGPDADGSFDTPAHHDFWRVSPNGLLFTRRGYSEDGRFRDVDPGTSFDITTPTWRLGEAILEAKYISEALNATGADLICHARWQGLKGRSLVSIGNPNRPFWSRNYVASQDTFEATERVAMSALPDALPELVFAMLQPLYELFDFFALPKLLVEQELASLRKRG